MRDGRLSGVEVAASVDGDYLGHDRFADFWAAAEETRALVFVHPTTRGFGIEALNDYYLWNTAGNPLETTITAAHMVMAGVLERHPDLRVLLAHAGGAILALRGRLRHSHSFQPDARSRLLGVAGRLDPPLLLRHGHPRRDAAPRRRSSSRAPSACCSAPTTRSTWASSGRPSRCARSASIPRTRR